MPKSFEDVFEEQSLRTLYRKMQKTARARFNAAHRFKQHHTFTLWTISLFSTGLIVLSVLPYYKVNIAIDSDGYALIQFLLALAILVISLLLTFGNYSDRAEKMHRSGLELNALCYSILPACKGNIDQSLYESTLAKYSNALNSYENHENIDFAFVKFDFPEDYPPKCGDKFKAYFLYWIRFWIHFALIAILAGSFYYALKKNEANKAMEPTPAAVTDPANAGSAPATSAAHLGR